MTKPIKPGLDRRVAEKLDSSWLAYINSSNRPWTRQWIGDVGCIIAIRAIARELPPTQAARLLKAAGIEKKGRRS